MNRKVVLNLVLAGEDGFFLRQQGYGAFATGALLAAGGIENDACHSGCFNEVCASVNGNLSAVGLKGYGVVLHFVERRS
jgi:hypothetical protein